MLDLSDNITAFRGFALSDVGKLDICIGQCHTIVPFPGWFIEVHAVHSSKWCGCFAGIILMIYRKLGGFSEKLAGFFKKLGDFFEKLAEIIYFLAEFFYFPGEFLSNRLQQSEK